MQVLHKTTHTTNRVESLATNRNLTNSCCENKQTKWNKH